MNLILYIIKKIESEKIRWRLFNDSI